MEELRLAFLVLGACAIAGILIHGLWSVRKNSHKGEQEYQSKQDWDKQADDDDSDTAADEAFRIDVDDPLLGGERAIQEVDDYDELGIGEVRVVSRESAPGQSESEPSAESTGDVTEQTDAAETVSEPEALYEEEEQTPKPRIYASVVSNPKPEYAAEQDAVLRRVGNTDKAGQEDMPEPPASLLRKEPVLDTSDSDDAPAPAQAEQADTQEAPPAEAADKAIQSRKKSAAATRKRKEPRIEEDQMRIDFDDPELGTPDIEAAAAQQTNPQQEVLVLNVKAPDDKPIQGAALLPMLLTLGFKFGDQDIFHRHVNSNGKGPVLFSLANMFKPGVFDIDNLENFSTQGVSLFMILPIDGDPHQVFNMMHNAARKIADEFSAQVLDGRRSALTKQSLQQYVEKIREFERMRMIAR